MPMSSEHSKTQTCSETDREKGLRNNWGEKHGHPVPAVK